MSSTYSQLQRAGLAAMLLALAIPAQQFEIRGGMVHAEVVTPATCTAGCSQQVIPGPSAATWEAQANCHSTGAQARASVSGNRIIVFCTNDDLGTVPSCPDPALPGSSAEIVVRISSPTPLAGVLTLDEGGRHINYEAYVDVGDDGTRELDSGLGTGCPACPIAVPVVVTPAGLDILVGASLTGPNESVFVNVDFTAGANGIATYQSPCQAELLAYRASTTSGGTRLQFLGQAGPGGIMPSFFVLGTARASTTLLPSGCVLGTHILVPLPAPVSPATMQSGLHVTGPPGLVGTVYAQFLWFRPLTAPGWYTSNALEITFP